MYDENDFQPCDAGNTSEVPPEAPEGEWLAIASARVMPRLERTGHPAIIVDYTLDRALTDGNESFVGARVTDWLTLAPKTEPKDCRRFVEKLHQVCAALGVPVPDRLGATLQSLQDFAAELEGKRGNIRTYINKKGYVNIGYARPARNAVPAQVAPAETPAEERPRRRARA